MPVSLYYYGFNMNLYQEIVMDHYRHPRNYGSLEYYDFSSDQINPSCGDSILMQGIIENNVIKELKFTGKGCVISQATASMLTQACREKSIDEVRSLDSTFIKKLIGIELGLLRIKCALLPLQALQEGIRFYKGQ